MSVPTGLVRGIRSDFVAICRLVEGEKAAVAKLKPEQDLYPQNAGPNP